MLKADLDEVCRIADSSFPLPWPRQVMEQELAKKYAVARVIRRGEGEKPCGFASYWVVADEIHLHNLAISPEMRRKGYAKALLLDMLEIARDREVETVWLEVRRSNRAAVSLYLKLGFEQAGVRPRYYADNQEDALIMVLRLD